MNFQDMQNLKKGDLVIVNGTFTFGEVNVEVTSKGTSCGAPCIWVKYIDRKGNEKASVIYTGADLREEAWYRNKRHLRIRWQSEEKEKISLEKHEQQSLF